MKILCLGNEFIKEDSFAKEIAKELINEKGFDIININDSFQLMDELAKDNKIIILDVVDKLKEVRLLKIDELQNSKIMTAHDFDAGFVLKLIGNKNKIKIIGLPNKGDINKIKAILSFIG